MSGIPALGQQPSLVTRNPLFSTHDTNVEEDELKKLTDISRDSQEDAKEHASDESDDEGKKLVYISDPPILCSMLMEDRIAFGHKWKDYKPRIIHIDKKALLTYRNVGYEHIVKGSLDLSHVEFTFIPTDVLPKSLNDVTSRLSADDSLIKRRNIGVTIRCKTLDGYETYFRCIVDKDEFRKIKSAVVLVATNHNADNIAPLSAIQSPENNTTPTASGSRSLQSQQKHSKQQFEYQDISTGKADSHSMQDVSNGRSTTAIATATAAAHAHASAPSEGDEDTSRSSGESSNADSTAPFNGSTSCASAATRRCIRRDGGSPAGGGEDRSSDGEGESYGLDAALSGESDSLKAANTAAAARVLDAVEGDDVLAPQLSVSKPVGGDTNALHSYAMSIASFANRGLSPLVEIHNKISKSIMRRSIAQALDRYDVRSRKERILAKRGALTWLPVCFKNDLVHGSWWFVWGSLGFMLTSVLAVANSVNPALLGDDDSQLPRPDYQASWSLMVVSGIFSTLGSLAFVRALHEDPPMRPLFSCYHFQNDELLGSWLFLLATIPFVPYTLIYLSVEHYRSPLYLVGLVVSLIISAGSYMFVRACYPSEKKSTKNLFAPAMQFVCYCFCSGGWLRRHLQNDWLAGTWFFLWATLAATFVSLVLFLAATGAQHHFMAFVLGTSFIENGCFLIGSAYFVAGSYPEGSLVIGDDDTDDVPGSGFSSALDAYMAQGDDRDEEVELGTPVTSAALLAADTKLKAGGMRKGSPKGGRKAAAAYGTGTSTNSSGGDLELYNMAPSSTHGAISRSAPAGSASADGRTLTRSGSRSGSRDMKHEIDSDDVVPPRRGGNQYSVAAITKDTGATIPYRKGYTHIPRTTDV